MKPKPHSTDGSEPLFVYGTLRQACRHPLHTWIAQHSRFLGPATFQGKLFNLGTYPGMIPSREPGDRVRGEVYLLHEAERDLKYVDDYEGFRGIRPLYCRELRPVILADGRKLDAWLYLYNRPVAGLTEISSGDYVEYIRSLKVEI